MSFSHGLRHFLLTAATIGVLQQQRFPIALYAVVTLVMVLIAHCLTFAVNRLMKSTAIRELQSSVSATVVKHLGAIAKLSHEALKWVIDCWSAKHLKISFPLLHRSLQNSKQPVEATSAQELYIRNFVRLGCCGYTQA